MQQASDCAQRFLTARTFQHKTSSPNEAAASRLPAAPATSISFETATTWNKPAAKDDNMWPALSAAASDILCPDGQAVVRLHRMMQCQAFEDLGADVPSLQAAATLTKGTHVSLLPQADQEVRAALCASHPSALLAPAAVTAGRQRRGYTVSWQPSYFEWPSVRCGRLLRGAAATLAHSQHSAVQPVPPRSALARAETPGDLRCCPQLRHPGCRS